MEDLAGESVICLGVIGVGSAILRQAEAVNAAKAELKAICSPLKRVYMRARQGATSSTRPIPAIPGVLRNIRRRLNLWPPIERFRSYGNTRLRDLHPGQHTRGVSEVGRGHR